MAYPLGLRVFNSLDFIKSHLKPQPQFLLATNPSVLSCCRGRKEVKNDQRYQNQRSAIFFAESLDTDAA